jgi:hypothetical protein
MFRKLAAAAVIVAATATGPVLAAASHDHSHGDAAPASGGLTLDHGRKWQTDAPLRTRMTAIGDEVRAALGPVHDKRYRDADFDALAERIGAQVDGIAAECRLPEAVDAQLHIVLADIIAATDAMKGRKGGRVSGVVAMLGVLDRYQAHFDHPGWKPVRH